MNNREPNNTELTQSNRPGQPGGDQWSSFPGPIPGYVQLSSTEDEQDQFRPAQTQLSNGPQEAQQ